MLEIEIVGDGLMRPIASARKPMDASEAREPSRRIAAQQADKPPVRPE
jgi:hypothetical protein